MEGDENSKRLSRGPKNPLSGNNGFIRLSSNDATMKPEVRKSCQDFIMHNAEVIYAYINRQDPRFNEEIILTGSVNQALKVHLPMEYDCMFSVALTGLWRGDIVKTRNHRSHGLTGDSGPDADHLNYDVTKILVPVKVDRQIGEGAVYDTMITNKMLWRRSNDMVREGYLVPHLVLQKLYQLLLRGSKEIKKSSR